MVFILGKSGSGKSTLLNVCGGLDKADSGEIVIKGKFLTARKSVGLARRERRHIHVLEYLVYYRFVALFVLKLERERDILLYRELVENAATATRLSDSYSKNTTFSTSSR